MAQNRVMKNGGRNAGQNIRRGKKKLAPLSEEEILNEYGVPAVMQSFAVSEVFSPEWSSPDIMLTANRWKSDMSKDEAVELCLICMGVEINSEVVTYEVMPNDLLEGYSVERRWMGEFTHWVAPLEYQVELREWKRRTEDG